MSSSAKIQTSHQITHTKLSSFLWCHPQHSAIHLVYQILCLQFPEQTSPSPSYHIILLVLLLGNHTHINAHTLALTLSLSHIPFPCDSLHLTATIKGQNPHLFSLITYFPVLHILLLFFASPALLASIRCLS